MNIDVVILLSYFGLLIDERIVLELLEIDIILGGYIYYLFENGKIEGNVLLVVVGRWGEYLGKVIIELDENN